MHCCLSFRVKSLLTAPRYSKASTPKYFSVNNVFLLPLASLVLISWRDSEQHDRSRDPLLIRSWALFHPKDKAWEGVRTVWQFWLGVGRAAQSVHVQF